MKLGANVEYGARSNNSALPDILIRGVHVPDALT